LDYIGWFRSILYNRLFLWTLVIFNGLGTIYGFFWYKNQLEQTPLHWLLFVPDSPTASGFFTLAILLYLLNRSNPWVEALGAVTSVKYGLWAVIMIVWTAALRVETTGASWSLQSFSYVEWMLMTSHLGMAIEAILYYRLYRFGVIHLLGVGIWTLTNDVIDYGWKMHPWVSNYLDPYIPTIAGLTVVLSGLSLGLFYLLKKKRAKTE
jgi:uncharacterized membrane protein YpjA